MSEAASLPDPMPTESLAQLRAEIEALSNSEDAVFLQRFFKTGRGQYGEGDRFRGIRVPVLRRLALEYWGLSHHDTLDLLRSDWHEERLLALLLLVRAFNRGNASAREQIYRAYLAHTRYINNWDLVDLSAEYIVGAFFGPQDLGPLQTLAKSDLVWERRIAILSTFHFIKRGTLGPTLQIADLLLRDRHDLVHKAVGWMLREVGKRDQPIEEAFLRKHHRAMPRTMLRYAIERFPESLRKEYLTGSVASTPGLQSSP
jgi:3-methyladenine DNA glycosylase AlkD